MALPFIEPRLWPLLVGMAAAAGCTSPPPEPLPISKPGDAAGSAVVRHPIAEPSSPTAASTEQPKSGLPIVIPPGVQYICVSEAGGQRRQTVIEFAPKVRDLCTNHPEMAPCQYERNACRRSGGRVFEANGTEITMQTEAEYDKKVTRVRLKSN